MATSVGYASCVGWLGALQVCELCEELESILLAFGDFIYFLPTLIHIK